ncbi:myosin heavy chain, striated muscle-like [Pangasianodon hypophthalmus]|uniref:myosin heavy chain, striated muscle-like n=1 Tax=Pangasianodon hypophthalmus TaxID=310915 RepID=UPI002307E33B|nr:myosin heavy chain, striated muscle-like [Pangasianodon hypophthalmus]
MKELMSLISAGVADLPLRPLLYTAGAAATAAGIYCFIKRGDGEKTPDPEDTTPSEDPVCDQATEPALVQPVEVPQDQVTDAVTEAEEKIQKLVVSNTQLEDRVRELEELLCEARRDCDMKNKAFEREQWAHGILQLKHDDMKEFMKVSLTKAEEKHQKALETIAQVEAEKSDLTDQVETLQGTVQYMWKLLCKTQRKADDLTKEREQEREAHSILQAENDVLKKTLIQKEELLKKSIFGVTILRFKKKKQYSQVQVETLQGTVQYMWKLLCETQRKADDLTKERERERDAHSILQAENDELKKTLIQKEELLKVSLAEAEEKHQKAVETNAQLEAEKSDLMYQVETLQGTMQDMGNLLCETHRECDQLTNERDREREAHSILQTENDELKKTLMHKNEFLKVSLTEAVEKHQKAVETIAQLEAEKSDLTYQVETLQGTVQDMGNLLSETHRQCDELTNECERQREAHSILQAENDQMKETLLHNEEFLKVFLAEAEEKHQKAVETIAQLEAEKSDMTYQVETLRGRVQDMGNLLCESHSQCDKLMNEREREREAHSILQVENDEMKKTLIQKEELLKVSLAEAEEKHQKAVETNAQLEAKISDLMYQVETLQGTMQDMGNLLYETNRECDELTNREREVHSILQAENDEMKKTLIQKEEFLKASLAEAEEKHQKAVETIAQLEVEKSNLTYQVETLRGTVQESGNLLSETHRQCDELTNECEREREAHSILQSEHNEMKEKLKHCEELLMVSFSTHYVIIAVVFFHHLLM